MKNFTDSSYSANIPAIAFHSEALAETDLQSFNPSTQSAAPTSSNTPTSQMSQITSITSAANDSAISSRIEALAETNILNSNHSTPTSTPPTSKMLPIVMTSSSEHFSANTTGMDSVGDTDTHDRSLSSSVKKVAASPLADEVEESDVEHMTPASTTASHILMSEVLPIAIVMFLGYISIATALTKINAETLNQSTSYSSSTDMVAAGSSADAVGQIEGGTADFSNPAGQTVTFSHVKGLVEDNAQIQDTPDKGFSINAATPELGVLQIDAQHATSSSSAGTVSSTSHKEAIGEPVQNITRMSSTSGTEFVLPPAAGQIDWGIFDPDVWHIVDDGEVSFRGLQSNDPRLRHDISIQYPERNDPSFHCFLKLPQELQNMIWLFSHPNPRVIDIWCWPDRNSPDSVVLNIFGGYEVMSLNPVGPGHYGVCKIARSIFKQHYRHLPVNISPILDPFIDSQGLPRGPLTTVEQSYTWVGYKDTLVVDVDQQAYMAELGVSYDWSRVEKLSIAFDRFRNVYAIKDWKKVVETAVDFAEKKFPRLTEFSILVGGRMSEFIETTHLLEIDEKLNDMVVLNEVDSRQTASHIAKYYSSSQAIKQKFSEVVKNNAFWRKVPFKTVLMSHINNEVTSDPYQPQTWSLTPHNPSAHPEYAEFTQREGDTYVTTPKPYPYAGTEIKIVDFDIEVEADKDGNLCSATKEVLSRQFERLRILE